ncbi:heme/hemin ABC transporter substrate-binding protein [Myroides sp. LJL119]
MKKITLLSLLVLVLVACQKQKTSNTPQETQTQRIISLNGSITETLEALNYGKDIIAVDVTSTYPEYIKQNAQDLGHATKISAESILALQPTSVYASSKDINEQTLQQLSNAGVKVQIIDQEFSLEGTNKMIEQVAKSLDNTSYPEIVSKIEKESNDIIPFEHTPSVLFIYARGTSVMMVAGQNTPIDAMITLAGAKNAVQGFNDYKPLTPEALIQANPDYILLFTTGLESLGNIEGILQIQGVEQTNAGKNKQIIAMDGQFLSGFGPRVGQAVKELNLLLQP